MASARCENVLIKLRTTLSHGMMPIKRLQAGVIPRLGASSVEGTDTEIGRHLAVEMGQPERRAQEDWDKTRYSWHFAVWVVGFGDQGR